jgi:hypothetical protein
MLWKFAADTVVDYASGNWQGTRAPLDQPQNVRDICKYLPGWRVNLLSSYSTVVFKVSSWR